MIGIVVALKSETNSLLDKFNNKKEIMLADKPAFLGEISGHKVILAISGIGKVSAALTTQIIIDKYSPDFILNFGTCGGMNNSVKIRNYYAIEKCIQYDFDLTKLEDVPLGYIQEYNTNFFLANTTGLDSFEKRNLATADKFTSNPNDVKTINDLGCSVCDMEGTAIAQVCTSNNIPLVMIKGISDVHGSGTHAEQFFKNLKAVGQGFANTIENVISSVCNAKNIND